MASGNFPSQVAQHYNQVEQKNLKDRKKSDIIELRSFNNAMKSWMHHVALKIVTNFPDRPIRVLDLGCGKGGDLPKYSRSNQIGLVVGFDIADVSIEQCRERYRSNPQFKRFKGQFFVADLTRADIRHTLLEHDLTDKFHFASSQFSIHYSFESFEQAVRYINNAANNLVHLGVFIGTYPDGPKLLKLARLSKTPGVYEVDDILRVEFSPEDMKNPKPFGTKYHFKLKEVVDCPEFLVHPRIFQSLMEKLGFHQVFDRSFEQQISEGLNSPADRKVFKEIFERHRALDIDYDSGTASFDEKMWSVASVYRCFCYRKIK